MPDSHSVPNHLPQPSAQDLAEVVTQGFAADLHDDLVPLLYVGRQSLLNACGQIKTLVQELSDSGEGSSDGGGDAVGLLQDHLVNLEQIEGWLSTAMEVSRGLIRQTHLADEALPRWWEALQHTLESIFPQENRLCWVGEPPRCSPDVARALYRIAGEAVRNAIRHSDAQRITVTWEPIPAHSPSIRNDGQKAREGFMRMTIADDGNGFDPTDVGESRFGLVGMRMRASLVGLPLRVQSQPGGPTLITVECWPASDGGKTASEGFS